MFKFNYEYSAKELAEELGVAYETFKNNKKKYLEALEAITDIKSYKKGNAQFYVITEQSDEYIPISKSQKHVNFVRDRLKYDILIQPDGARQTAANVGEMLCKEMGVSEQTASRQASIVLKQYQGCNEGDEGEDGAVGKKVQAYHQGNTWQELPQEILQEMIEAYGEELNRKGLGADAELSAFEDYEENSFSVGELARERMKVQNKIKYKICQEEDWRWIMKVREYKVHKPSQESDFFKD